MSMPKYYQDEHVTLYHGDCRARRRRPVARKVAA